jgi:hypothetical protein
MEASMVEKNLNGIEITQTKKVKAHFENFTGIGAMISCLIASIAVIQYLLSTVITMSGMQFENLMSYVLGTSHGLEALASEGLFIVITRFILVFSIFWLPLTFVVYLLNRRR